MRNVSHKMRASRMNSYLEDIEHAQGPAPVNLFKKCRLEAGLTLVQFAEVTGVSKQSVIRLEQGVPTDPVEGVLEYLVKATDYTYPELTNDYYDYQRSLRSRHKFLFGPFIRSLTTEHPLDTLMSQWSLPDGTPVGKLNVTEVAKLLCISQSLLDHFYNKPERQLTVPSAFQQALRDNGYSRDEIEAFNISYRAWRSKLPGVAVDEPITVDVTHVDSDPNEPSLKDQMMSELFG